MLSLTKLEWPQRWGGKRASNFHLQSEDSHFTRTPDIKNGIDCACLRSYIRQILQILPYCTKYCAMAHQQNPQIHLKLPEEKTVFNRSTQKPLTWRSSALLLIPSLSQWLSFWAQVVERGSLPIGSFWDLSAATRWESKQRTCKVKIQIKPNVYELMPRFVYYNWRIWIQFCTKCSNT